MPFVCCTSAALSLFVLTVSSLCQQAEPAAPAKPAPIQQESLADMARKLRKDKPSDVKMSAEEGKDLFRSVDKVFDFASEDTGFPRRGPIKKAVVGQADIEKFTKERLAREDFSQRFARSELTMKKFGLLPRDFNLREFLVKSNGQTIAGLYDEETKTIWMLNTVAFDRQGPILAHELTHALQDQNYDLKHWAEAGAKRDKMKGAESESGNDETSTARHAIVEGQAMVVYIDFLLAPWGRNLKDTPGVVASMQDSAVSATIDNELMHHAPMFLREAGSFPYRDGLFFVADVLAKRGKEAAFAGVFAHPPRNTHEVFDSNAYLEHAKLPPVLIPDVRPLLTDYEVFDSGSFGELDVRALLKQFGDKHGAEDFASAWQGGSYVAFKRTQPGSQPTAEATTANIGLLYVSQWKTTQAAEHFARFYATTVAWRYKNAKVQDVPTCTAAPCPVGAALVSTEEGPVIVEEWPDNTVIVTESFDSATEAKLSSAVRTSAREQQTWSGAQEELGMRLLGMPAFRGFQERLEEDGLEGITKVHGAQSQ
jgi:hypothetical protein